MPEQDTDVLEVLISQVGECRNADPIFSKAFCILPETERFEPLRGLLRRRAAMLSSFRPNVSLQLRRLTGSRPSWLDACSGGLFHRLRLWAGNEAS